MTLSFRYKKETIEGKTAYFPKIPITLHGPLTSFDTAALLDSGATNIFVPQSIAQALGLETGKTEPVDSWTEKFEAKTSHIGISFAKGSQTFRKTLPCLIPQTEEGYQESVLGRTFFKFFEITFNEEKQLTHLKKIR